MPESPFRPFFHPASRKLWQAALAIYWLTLFVATHVPGDFPGLPGDGWDKVVHFSAFALLAALLATAWQVASRQLTTRQLIWAWIAIVAYAAIDEWTQSFVGRDSSVFDWLADAVGAAVGLSVFVCLGIGAAQRSTVVQIDEQTESGLKLK